MAGTARRATRERVSFAAMHQGLALLASIALGCVSCTRPAGRDPSRPTSGPASSEPPAIALNADSIANDLRTLADDGWAGRFTKDLEHLGAAADYIAASHHAAGLQPVGSSYRIDFEYPAGREPGDAFYLWVERAGETRQIPEEDVPAAGFGAGRAVVAAPAWIAGDATAGVEGYVVVTPAPTGPMQDRVEALARAGASAVLFVVDTVPEVEATAASMPVSTAWIARDMAHEAFGLPSGTPPPTATALEGVRLSLTRSETSVAALAPNVLAWIEGSEHPEEIILLGAHYDHIGTQNFGTFCRGPENDADPDDTICNGADDNASGTALLMEIARAMGTSGYRPKRSLVFAHFAGEELGLLGSKALAESPPSAAPFLGGTVVAMINMDMVGRYGPDGLQVGGERTSPAWPPILEAAGVGGLQVVHPASVTGRSDHAHWLRQGIPTLFFFTGLHDDYHRTSDEVEAINLQGIADIGALVLGVTMALAEGAPIPRVSEPNE